MKPAVTMTACADKRSIFDLCPDDEALTGLREVNPNQEESVNTKPASDGMYVGMYVFQLSVIRTTTFIS